MLSIFGVSLVLYFIKILSGSRNIVILYLKFQLSNQKTTFVPRDNVIFYGISLKFVISQCSVRYYNYEATHQRPNDLVNYSINIHIYSNLRPSTNRKHFRAFVYV